MSQWMSGDMLMIGDMFNHDLKAKVDRLCHDVAAAIAARPGRVDDTPEMEPRVNQISWWPAGLGIPAAAGSQNDMRYAFFPAAKRLVIDDNGAVSIVRHWRRISHGSRAAAEHRADAKLFKHRWAGTAFEVQPRED